jgi:hypothetical protein
MSDRLKKISSSVRSAIKAGLLPWDLDSPAIIDGEIGPYMNMKATLKNDEKLVDIEVETKNGREEYTDMPLRLNWSNKLRGLKFSGMIKKLMDAKIISKSFPPPLYYALVRKVIFVFSFRPLHRNQRRNSHHGQHYLRLRAEQLLDP